MEKFIKPIFALDKTVSNDSKSTFVLSPLERGFGYTIGHTLRRVALSNIPGTSPFAIQIKGIDHEFQAIEGIDKDVVGIILAIKELEISADLDMIKPEELITLKLKSSKGVVKASDIEAPAGVTIVNGDFEICKASKDGALDMSIYANLGRGYKTNEENRKTVISNLGDRVGIIPIDSMYSPVKSFNYRVESTNPGQDIEQERLVIEIETKANQNPADVIAIGAKIVIGFFDKLVEVSESTEVSKSFTYGQFADDEEIRIAPTPITSKQISELDLSVRSFNALKAAGLETIDDLTDKSLDEVKQIQNLGAKSVEEITDKVHELGYKFRGE